MGEFVRAVASEKVREGELRLGFVGVKRVAFVRLDGTVYAFNNACPHAGAPLSAGGVQNGRVVCSRHQWAFDVRSGNCETNPDYCLRAFEVRERDGWVEARAPDEIW